MKLVKRNGEVYFKISVMMLLVFDIIFPLVSHAARPFITDDSGTVGKNVFQIESGIEVSLKTDSSENNKKVKEAEKELTTAFTCGIKDNLDLMLELPYSWKKTKEDGVSVFNKNGLSDITLLAKWRFYEKDGLGIALKPGISAPTGEYKKGFGAGKAGYGAEFVISYELAPFGFHFNGGYTRNENKTGERNDLFSTSFAVTCEVIKNLIIGGDIGISSNTDPKTKTAYAFMLFGGNYRIGKYITIDGGVKLGLNRYEVNHEFICGITLNF